MSQMKQEQHREEEGKRRDRGLDGAERQSNMEEVELSYMPARRPTPGARFQEHEISSGKCRGTDRK